MNRILEDYQKNESLFADFKNMLKGLIHDLLVSSNVNAHQITGRVKTFDSLEKKIEGKKGKYAHLSDITDCVGLRIIAYLEDEVDLIAEIIQKELKIDPINSIDKRKLDADRFGYKSLHFVVSLKPNRTKLKEYSKYKGLKAEIQIRSILQHAWAEIEHDLGYKSAITVPEFLRRDFFRVAALLETADKAFISIKQSIEKYSLSIESELVSSPEKFLLDKNTLTNYADNSPIVAQINIEVSKASKLPITGTKGDLEYLLKAYNKFGIESIEELDKLIKLRIDDIKKFATLEITTSSQEYTGTGTAIALHTLPAILNVESGKNDVEFFDDNELTFERANEIYLAMKN